MKVVRVDIFKMYNSDVGKSADAGFSVHCGYKPVWSLGEFIPLSTRRESKQPTLLISTYREKNRIRVTPFFLFAVSLIIVMSPMSPCGPFLGSSSTGSLWSLSAEGKWALISVRKQKLTLLAEKAAKKGWEWSLAVHSARLGAGTFLSAIN